MKRTTLSKKNAMAAARTRSKRSYAQSAIPNRSMRAPKPISAGWLNSGAAPKSCAAPSRFFYARARGVERGSLGDS